MQTEKAGLFLAAAAAAFGAYKYYKMTPEQRKNLKTRGRDFISKKMGVLKNASEKKNAAVMGNYY
jgi:hypothetical protein